MIEIASLDAESVMSDATLDEVFEETDPIMRSRLLLSLQERAKILGVKTKFDTIVRAYNKVKKCYSIIDWKTSKSFDTSNVKGEKLLAPFTDFDACNVNEYSIQLSTYAYILEKHTSIRIGEMVLFQIPKASTAPTICVCNDMRPYLKTILK